MGECGWKKWINGAHEGMGGLQKVEIRVQDRMKGTKEEQAGVSNLGLSMSPHTPFGGYVPINEPRRLHNNLT